MSFEIEGKLHKVFETEQKTESFRTREFVLLVEQGSYPQYIKFQLVQDRTDIIDDHNEGDQIKVYFDLRGREWNEKYFTNLSAWRIEALEAGSQPGATADDPGVGTSSALADTDSDTRAEDFGDLPF
jgi:single-strand DNA-binding protein